MRYLGRVVLVAVSWGAPLVAQDTLRPVEGVRVGITYTPGLRPGLLVLGGPRQELLDSVRAMGERDLDFRDRFEMITLPGRDSLMLAIGAGSATRGSTGPFVNYALYEALGADYTVSVLDRPDSGLAGVGYDVKGRGVRRGGPVRGTSGGHGELRVGGHRGEPGGVRGRWAGVSGGCGRRGRGSPYSGRSERDVAHLDAGRRAVRVFRPAIGPAVRPGRERRATRGDPTDDVRAELHARAGAGWSGPVVRARQRRGDPRVRV